MGLISKFWHTLTAPWRLSEAVELYQAGQIALLHEVMGISRAQAEANVSLLALFHAMHGAAMAEGPPEGRDGLSDEDEFAMNLQRQDLRPKRTES